MQVATETVPAWLRGLTDQQRAAVDHRGPPLLVAAGAGSGKTRTLATRTAALLADGHAPERLLLLTFTRRAAAELLGRSGALVPELGADRVGGGTFHALAVRLLRLHGGRLGLPSDFAVLDRADAVDLMGIVRVETGVAEGDERAPSATALVDVLSRCVIAGEPLDDVLPDRFPWIAPHRDDVARAFDAFTAAKRRAGVLDLDDLQLHLRALLDDDAVGAQIGADLDHVLVDEVQDVDPVQLDILALLCANGAELTAVGDELQAIYGFRAGDGRGIRRLHERFDDLVTVHLSTSFRCPPPVLDVANGLSAEIAPDRPPLVAHDRTTTTARPSLTTCLDPGDEAALVVDRVLADRERGIPLQEQAVLFRTGHHADRVELELTRRDVPYRKFGGLRYVDTAHVRDLVAILRLLDTPHDEVAWQRTLRSLRGVGPVSARHTATTIGVGDRTTQPGPVARLLDPATEVPGDPVDVAALRTALAGAAGDGAAEPPPPVQVDAALELLERTLPRRHRDAPSRLAHLAELAVVAAGYTRRRDLLADLALDPPDVAGDVAPGNVDEEWLTLSTIHSAKGGEWDVVHLLHAADGNLPSDLAARRSEDMEEERRLAYVAVTRARRRLHVTYPTRFPTSHGPRSDRDAAAKVSRFLDPLADLFERGATPRGSSEDGAALLRDGALRDAVDRQLADLW